MPLISVCVPVHDMENGEFFLNRLKESLDKQTFRDFELVVTEEGTMAENTNAAIRKARGKIIKVLYMDDYLSHEQALQNIADNFTGGWLASPCLHDDGTGYRNPHTPWYEESQSAASNTIGSPSVVAFANDNPPLFDENMTWLLDVDLYRRFFKKWGQPVVLSTLDIVIGLHKGQMSNLLSDEDKNKEAVYLSNKLQAEPFI